MSHLRAEHLKKAFKKKIVVSDVSLEVRAGECVGLLGPNGAGKTTCFYMIVGLETVDSGRIFLGDTEITKMPMHQRARLGIGYLPQEASVFRKLSVADNIMAILELRGDCDEHARQNRLVELLEEFHLTHIMHNIGMSLSGGERRRVEIARALAMDVRFILLDEPFAGVDPISVIDIKKIIKHLCDKGIGVLITDHNVRETLGCCHRAYIMNQGQVICSGDPQHVLSDKRVREVYLGEDFAL